MKKIIEYDGNNIILIKVISDKDEYMISYNNGRIICSCSVKHKREWSIICKHIKFAFGVVDENNNKVLK